MRPNPHPQVGDTEVCRDLPPPSATRHETGGRRGRVVLISIPWMRTLVGRHAAHGDETSSAGRSPDRRAA